MYFSETIASELRMQLINCGYVQLISSGCQLLHDEIPNELIFYWFYRYCRPQAAIHALQAAEAAFDCC